MGKRGVVRWEQEEGTGKRGGGRVYWDKGIGKREEGSRERLDAGRIDYFSFLFVKRIY